MTPYKPPSKLKEYKVPITLFRKEQAYITVSASSKKDAVKIAERNYNAEKDECLENKEDQGYDNFFLSEPEEINIPVIKNGRLNIETNKEYTLMFLGKPHIFYRDYFKGTLLKEQESSENIPRVFINAYNIEDNSLYFIELPLSVAQSINYLWNDKFYLYKLVRTGQKARTHYNISKLMESTPPKNVDLYDFNLE